MSHTDEDRKGRLDRRAVIAAAGAAALLPGAAHAEEPRFVIDLGDVRLPQAAAAKLERDIRRVVLMALAQALPHTKFRSVPLPQGTRGIAVRPV